MNVVTDLCAGDDAVVEIEEKVSRRVPRVHVDGQLGTLNSSLKKLPISRKSKMMIAWILESNEDSKGFPLKSVATSKEHIEGYSL